MNVKTTRMKGFRLPIPREGTAYAMILFVVALAATGCGKGATESELMLTGNDQIQFNKKEFRVKAGSTVTLTLKHIGKLGKDAMGHNFVLLKKDTDIAKFAEKAIAAKENDYIPPKSKKVIAHTKLLGGGQKDTITFTAPAKGTYPFICSFPGHYVQMQGKLIVE